jgi:hypothetical protein
MVPLLLHKPAPGAVMFAAPLTAVDGASVQLLGPVAVKFAVGPV